MHLTHRLTAALLLTASVLVNAAHAFAGNKELDDDLTVVAIEVLPPRS